MVPAEAFDGKGHKLHVAPRQVLRLLHERQQVPPLIGDDVLFRGVDQLDQFHRVGEGPRLVQLVRRTRQEGLLPLRAVQIAHGQAVPLPYEGQRLLAVEALASRREVGAREAVLHGVLQTHRYAVQGARQMVETGQVQLGEVVDRDAEEGADRVDLRLAPRLAPLVLQLPPVLDPLGGELLLVLGLRPPVGLLDLGLAGEPGHAVHLDEVVARHREGLRLAPVTGYVEQDQGVGVVAADVGAARVQLVQDVLGQRLAVLVAAAVQAHQEDVHISVLRLLGPLQGLGAADGGDEVLVQVPGGAAHEHHQRTGSRQHGPGEPGPARGPAGPAAPGRGGLRFLGLPAVRTHGCRC